MQTNELTLKKISELLKKGEVTSEQITQSYLNNIEDKDQDIHAYLEVFDDVIKNSKTADAERKSGGDGLLLGVPIAIKDNILIKGKICSAASKSLENYKATYDAHVIEKLRKAGAIFIGRTNMDEFAMGASTENSAFGNTKNPHDYTRVPGGSSGGSAAAVGGDLAIAAMGSDTGGSVRQPSAFCGVVGLKPTYGAVSRYGLIAMASSLDQIGPITKTVEDSELLFSVIRGHDPKDSTSYSGKSPSSNGNKKLSIGVPYDFVEHDGVENAVKENFNDSIKKLENDGHVIKNISLPSLKYSLASYYILVFAEISSNLARFDGIRYGVTQYGATLFEDYAKTRVRGFGKEVRRRVLMGTYVLSAGYYDAYYHKANIVRDKITKDFQKAFEEVNIIAMPTTPAPAFKIGEKTKDPVQMYLEDIFTEPANLAGVPAISIPSGTMRKDGVDLPLGMQFIAPHFREADLFTIGKSFEALNNTKII